MTGRAPDVVVIGAGPTGLAVATLLGRYGVDVLVLERWDAVFPQPRAVHLDDEVYRIVGQLGIAEGFDRISRPSHGLRLVRWDMEVLAEFRRDGVQGRHGFPQANMFDQPGFEALLRDNLRSRPGVTVRGDVKVEAVVADGPGRVRVEFTDRVSGRRESLVTTYALGCDGANSLVRRAVGSRLRDLHFDQRWLVVDVDTAADLEAWEGVHQVCDPVRAATYMRVGDVRHRWEFRLLDGETAGDFPDLASLQPLIAPWTRGIPADQLDLVRVAEYTFRARLADRWRVGNVLLLGDAAHLTPPFVGQGVGAGLRDAANLAWKLAGVLRGDLPDAALDSYEQERKPHVRTLIRVAIVVGFLMTAGGERATTLRRLLAPRLRWVPGLRARVLDSATPPLRSSAFVDRSWRDPRGLAGSLCPNAVLRDGLRFDEFAAGRFAVVTTATPSAAQCAAARARSGALVLVRPDEPLGRWLQAGRSEAALVRPDGTVMRAGRLDPVLAAMPRFTAAGAGTR